MWNTWNFKRRGRYRLQNQHLPDFVSLTPTKRLPKNHKIPCKMSSIYCNSTRSMKHYEQ
jgi:hypothetical protein